MKKMKTWHFDKIEEMIKGMSDPDKKIVYSLFAREEVAKAFPKVSIIPYLIKDEDKEKGKKKKEAKKERVKVSVQIEKTGKNDYSVNAFQLTKDKLYDQYTACMKAAEEAKSEIRHKIFETFGIKDNPIYKNKFDWACDGEGDELKKISSLTSSSLCAFLCFHSVSKEKPLIIRILNKYDVTFTESIFEWENSLVKFPSSIDVVLIGGYIDEKGEKHKVVYFVESKFSEYFNTGPAEITSGYLENEVGKRLFLNEKNFTETLKLKYQKSSDKFIKIGYRDGQFAEGVKQMFGHYMGVVNLLKGKKEYNFGKYLILPEDTEVYLGTIIFEIGKDTDPGNHYNNYIKLMKEACGILSRDLHAAKKTKTIDSRFVEVLHPIKYQTIFNSKKYKQNVDNLTEQVKIFYNFK